MLVFRKKKKESMAAMSLPESSSDQGKSRSDVLREIYEFLDGG